MAGRTYNTDWKSRKATKSAVEKFEAQFAKDMGIDLAEVNDDYEVVSTGSLNLDYAIGIGGVPTGRICEIWGPEHAGKTTLMCLLVAQYQKAFPDKKVAWVDMEQTFDPKWAALLGVDVKAMWRSPVKTAEDTADATKRFVESGLCSLVILDSIGGMIAKKEFEKDADEATVALIAKIVTRMVKQVSPMAKHNGTTVFVVNQVRSQIGGYGPDQTTGGGWALKHVTSLKFLVKRAGGVLPHTITVDGQKVPVGFQMAVKVEKNKLAPYGMVANLWLHNRETTEFGPVGVDGVAEVFDFAKRLRLMGTKAGGYYQFPDGTEVRGEGAAKDYLQGHPEVVEEYRKQALVSLVTLGTEDFSDIEGLGEDEGDLGIAGMVQ